MLIDLTNLIDEWLKDRSSRNLSLLARQSGVPYPTLRRVYLRENSPSLETVLALLNVIASTDNTLQFLARHFHSVGGWVQKLVRGMDTQIAGPDLNEELRDRISFAIITLASARGTTISAIERRFGEYGVAKLRRLLEMDLLYEEGERVRLRMENFSVIDPRLILEQIKHTVDLFDLSQIGETAACAQIHTDGISGEGVDALSRRISEFEEDLQEIFKKYPGSNVVMLSYVSSFLQRGEP